MRVTSLTNTCSVSSLLWCIKLSLTFSFNVCHHSVSRTTQWATPPKSRRVFLQWLHNHAIKYIENRSIRCVLSNSTLGSFVTFFVALAAGWWCSRPTWLPLLLYLLEHPFGLCSKQLTFLYPQSSSTGYILSALLLLALSALTRLSKLLILL